MSQLLITLGTPGQTIDLEFDVMDTTVAQRWLDQVRMFIALGSGFDDQERFYNFPNTKFTREYCIQRLEEIIAILRPWVSELEDWTTLGDPNQNTLNQLHHVFEVYHGLYDQQKQNYRFQRMPAEARAAVADLNIWIHRMETLGQAPRFVVTWHKKPTRLPFTAEDFQMMSLEEHWGDLRLNYCDIGKTLECLWQDQDQYISPQAFRPMQHFGMDFVVKFSEHDRRYFQNRAREIWKFYDQHQVQFNDLGYHRQAPTLQLGSITVAKIRYQGTRADLIREISAHARVHALKILD